jgi:hypothetical protein
MYRLYDLRFVKNWVYKSVLTSSGDLRVGKVNRLPDPPGFKFSYGQESYTPWSINNGRLYIKGDLEGMVQHWYLSPSNPYPRSLAFRNESVFLFLKSIVNGC